MDKIANGNPSHVDWPVPSGFITDAFGIKIDPLVIGSRSAAYSAACSDSISTLRLARVEENPEVFKTSIRVFSARKHAASSYSTASVTCAVWDTDAEADVTVTV